MRPRAIISTSAANIVTLFIFTGMLTARGFLSRRLQSSRIHQVRFSLSYLNSHPNFLSTFLNERNSKPKSMRNECNSKSVLNSVEDSNFGNRFISKWSSFWHDQVDNFAFTRKKEVHSHCNADSTPLKELLLKVSHLIPETYRKFLRLRELKPEHVLKLLLDSQLGFENSTIEASKIEPLWGIFKWAVDQNRGFKHLPQSCEIMASFLLRAGMVGEVELLLSDMERQGISLDGNDIFCALIESYVNAHKIDRAVLIYDQIREKGMIPSLSCYRSLLELLMELRETRSAFCLYKEMIEVGIEIGDVEARNLENLVQLLCQDGRVQQARKLVEGIVASGSEPTDLVLNEIAHVYYEKKDFEDLISFFIRMKRAPDELLVNKVLHSMCSSYGIERTRSFLHEMYQLGFNSSERTLGILISWSCYDGDLRAAFLYLSEIFSKNMEPSVYTYNSLISGLFREGLWKHSQEIVNEMIDNGINPDVTTFKVLLAGYCKVRQFDEVRRIIAEMVKSGLLQLSPLEDPVSRAFVVLGLNPAAVKVKRDNSVGQSKTEFFDALGNGLYLDADLDKFDNTVTAILKDSLVPDFNMLVRTECDIMDLRCALDLVDEMAYWGQELKLPSLTTLVRGLCNSPRYVTAVTVLLHKVPKLFTQLGPEILNLLVQWLGRKCFIVEGKLLLETMRQRHLQIQNESYTALLLGLCRKGHSRDVIYCWDLAQKDGWSPGLTACDALLDYFCSRKMLKEALGLFNSIFTSNPQLKSETYDVFFEKLCATGFTESAHVLLDKLLMLGHALDGSSYDHLIRGYCKEKRFSKALDVLDNLLRQNLVPCPDVLLSIVPLLFNANRVEQAFSLKDTILLEYPSVSASLYSALLNGCFREGKVAEADNLVLEMILDRVHWNAEIVDALVQMHSVVDEWIKVREIIGVMIRKWMKISASCYRSLIKLMCRKCMIVAALRLKRFMLSQSDISFLILHNILIFHLFRTGNSSHVLALLDEVEELDEVSCNFLVDGFAKSNDMSMSMHYMDVMVSRGLRPSNRSLRSVICCLCADGKIEEALRLSKKMELGGLVHGSVVQQTLVKCLLSHGRVTEAESFLNRMAVKSLMPNYIHYENLIQSFSRCGRLHTAVNLLNMMLHKGNLPDSACYDSIVQGFCDLHMVDRSMDFFTEMMAWNLKPSINTWEIVIHMLCQNGEAVEAERLLISMLKKGEVPTRRMYCSVIDRYHFENNLSKASEVIGLMQEGGEKPDFGTHWSLVSNLSNASQKDGSGRKHFLSKLLSWSGFSSKDGSKGKFRK